MDDVRVRSRTVLLVSSTAALGGFLFGYDSAVINGAVGAIAAHFHAGAAALGFTVASALLGAAGGALGAGRIADGGGRLVPMRIAAVLFTISALGCGFADSLLLLSAFRVIGGVAIGIASGSRLRTLPRSRPRISADGLDRCSN